MRAASMLVMHVRAVGGIQAALPLRACVLATSCTRSLMLRRRHRFDYQATAAPAGRPHPTPAARRRGRRGQVSAVLTNGGGSGDFDAATNDELERTLPSATHWLVAMRACMHQSPDAGCLQRRAGCC